MVGCDVMQSNLYVTIVFKNKVGMKWLNVPNFSPILRKIRSHDFIYIHIYILKISEKKTTELKLLKLLSHVHIASYVQFSSKAYSIQEDKKILFSAGWKRTTHRIMI